jgi:hypothetical protein
VLKRLPVSFLEVTATLERGNQHVVPAMLKAEALIVGLVFAAKS